MGKQKIINLLNQENFSLVERLKAEEDLNLVKRRVKYNINKELLKIAKQKAPSNIKLYPLINCAMKYMFKCKSDDAVNVIQYEIAGYMDAKLKTYVIEPRCCKKEVSLYLLF